MWKWNFVEGIIEKSKNSSSSFGALLRFFANKFWFRISKSGDVRIYSKKELEAIIYNSGFKEVQVYKKDKGLFLKAKK